MSKNTETKEKAYTIDATNKQLGRVASTAAHVLMGKHEPTFVKNKIVAPDVVIENISKVNTNRRKERGKTYASYSGYPGGLRHTTMEEVVKKHGYAEALRRAIRGMLPDNKLRNERLKKLTINE